MNFKNPIPCYYGIPNKDELTVEEWCDHVQLIITACEWDEAKSCLMTRLALRGQALLWIGRLGNSFTWTHFRTQIIGRFGESAEELINKIQTRVQLVNESVGSYTDDYFNLLSRVSATEYAIPDKLQKCGYVEGLLPRLRDILIIRDPATLLEASQTARALELQFHRLKSDKFSIFNLVQDQIEEYPGENNDLAALKQLSGQMEVMQIKLLKWRRHHKATTVPWRTIFPQNSSTRTSVSNDMKTRMTTTPTLAGQKNQYTRFWTPTTQCWMPPSPTKEDHRSELDLTLAATHNPYPSACQSPVEFNPYKLLHEHLQQGPPLDQSDHRHKVSPSNHGTPLPLGQYLLQYDPLNLRFLKLKCLLSNGNMYLNRRMS